MEDAKAIFICNGNKIIIKCNKEETMKDICNKFCLKVEKNIENLSFFYNSSKIDYNLTFNEQVQFKNIKDLNIFVYEDNKIDENYDINDYIEIKYRIEKIGKSMNIFGHRFVENNKSLCKIIYEGKEYELSQKFNLKKNNGKEILEIKLKGIKNITDISFMFSYCDNLLEISNFDTKNIVNMECLFSGCARMPNLPDISKWNTSNVTNMSSLFSKCSSITKFPDISNWDTSNVKNMSYMFSECSTIETFPDISKWDTSNVMNMSHIFSECSSIKSFPDI